VAISGTFPAISHVAVTVTDLSVSEAWYTRVFGVGPILDEDTGPSGTSSTSWATPCSGYTAFPT
jgi:catechol 2,3-dioxygenase-like lactoylglutathione lyase family enzyme